MNENRIKELIEKKIIPSSGVVFKIFQELYKDALYCNYDKPSEYIKEMWERYKQQDNNNNTNGKVFESIVAAIFYREKIYPIFVQAKIAFVPNINFDFVIYSKEYGPIALSLKTSLRERYKQADLESVSLKYVHRKAKCFLFTLDLAETFNVNKKIKNGDLLGIDEVYLVTSEDFDKLIEELKQLKLYEPQQIKVITSQKVIKP